MDMQEPLSSPFSVAIHMVGILLGTASAAVLLYVTMKYGYKGKLKTLFVTLIAGIVFQVLSFIADLFLSIPGLFPPLENFHELHDILMTVGIMFFVYSAKLYLDISQTIMPK